MQSASAESLTHEHDHGYPCHAPVSITPETVDGLKRKLDGLRTELVELAFELDCRGSGEAADVAMATSIRVGELCAGFPNSSQS